MFLVLVFFFVILSREEYGGGSGGLGTLNEANASSLLLGYVSLHKEQDRQVWTGWLRDGQGRGARIFEFSPSGARAEQEYTLAPRRFFAWAGRYAAYCGARQKEVILVDYRTKKEVFRRSLPECITYLNANPKDEFLIATEKSLYILQPAKESKTPRSSGKKPAFILHRLKNGVFHWPALSPDGQRVAVGRKDEKGEGIALVVFDLSSGREKVMLSPYFDPNAPEVAYRLITSIAWSPDGQRLVVGTTSPADPPVEWLVIIDPEVGSRQELVEATQLYTPPGHFTPDGKYYIFSQGKPDYREFMGEGNQYTGPNIPDPFHAKLVLLDLETGGLTYFQQIPASLNAYWPSCDEQENIYFLDEDIEFGVNPPLHQPIETIVGIYRMPLQGGQPKLLLRVKGLISYAVIPSNGN